MAKGEFHTFHTHDLLWFNSKDTPKGCISFDEAAIDSHDGNAV